MAMVITSLPTPAMAGCIDGGCGRIDWTEVTDSTKDGKTVSAKLHGVFAWESSDGWADNHPVAGSLSGFIWLSCALEDSANDNECDGKMMAALSKSGTEEQFLFGGTFSEGNGEDFKAVPPDFLYAEGTDGMAVSPSNIHANTTPFNDQTCPTAFYMDTNVDPNLCKPDCSGKACGDDACGGSCGVCAEGETCGDDGQCTSPACIPDCPDEGGGAVNCGDDGCGSPCGACEDDEECGSNDYCVKNACDPDCEGKVCGDDGCGSPCGACGDEETCGDDGQCAACEPTCTRENDGETITLTCGDNGCGGSCGMCGEPSICQDGVCSVPPCDAITIEGEQMCGMNGCGWDWGTCPDGKVCGGESFCVDETKTESSGGGCTIGSATTTGGLLFLFALGLLALIGTRTRRNEI